MHHVYIYIYIYSHFNVNSLGEGMHPFVMEGLSRYKHTQLIQHFFKNLINFFFFFVTQLVVKK